MPGIRTRRTGSAMLLLSGLLAGCSVLTPVENCGPLYGVARLGAVGDVYHSGRAVHNVEGYVQTTFGIQEHYRIDRGTLDTLVENGDIVAFMVDRGALDKYPGLGWGPRAFDVRPCKLSRSAARRILSQQEYQRYEREGRFD